MSISDLRLERIKKFRFWLFQLQRQIHRYPWMDKMQPSVWKAYGVKQPRPCGARLSGEPPAVGDESCQCEAQNGSSVKSPSWSKGPLKRWDHKRASKGRWAHHLIFYAASGINFAVMGTFGNTCSKQVPASRGLSDKRNEGEIPAQRNLLGVFAFF